MSSDSAKNEAEDEFGARMTEDEILLLVEAGHLSPEEALEKLRSMGLRRVGFSLGQVLRAIAGTPVG